MLIGVLDRAQNVCVSSKISSKLSGFLFILLISAVLSGCGTGHSSQTNDNPTSGTGSGSGLSISASLPAGSVGTSYTGSVTASGGSGSYTFSIASGQLPSGVQMASTSGSVSGTPSASGSFSFSVSVSDSKGDSEQKSFQMSVSGNSGSGGNSGGSGASSGSGGSGSSSGSGTGSAGSGNSGGKMFSNLQRAGGWGQFGQGPPNFVDCSPSPCNGIAFSMRQGVSNPSMSGQADEFNVGGSAPYSDALFNNHLIGPSSSQGQPDNGQTQVPSLYNFTYDAYFYGDNLDLSEALEFDVNQFFGGMGFIFGHECRIAAGNEWDVWDNANAKWVHTGVPCYPNSNQWNHVILKVQRTSDNHLTYQSITLNGQTTTLNWTFDHGSAPNWYGLTVNFQMDGDSKQDSYNVYLDNLNLSYQ